MIDSYQYLIYLVFQHADNTGGWSWDNSDPVYQRAVDSIWQASLSVLRGYEMESPYDTAMRGDSITVLYSNLAKMGIMREPSVAGSEFYADLYRRIGEEIPVG